MAGASAAAGAMLLLSRFSHVRLFAIPGTVTCQAPLSVGFSRLEYWNGLPFPPPGDLPNPENEPGLFYCRRILSCLSHQGALLDSGWVLNPIRVSVLRGRNGEDTETEGRKP